MADGKTVQMQKRAVEELREEAGRLKGEFRDYLDDLEILSRREFWKSVEQLESGKAKRFADVGEMLKGLDA